MNPQPPETSLQFEDRKREHIRLALLDENEAIGFSGFEKVGLWHEALPELNFSDVEIQTEILKKNRKTPFLVSSMTAGHRDSSQLNALLARTCEDRGWIFGVGSQRRELTDAAVRDEWRQVRKASPRAAILGNLGLAQVIETPTDKIRELVEALQAEAMIVHLNTLQECIQPEGTPNFKNGLKRIQQLCEELTVPVIVKETGCGFSPQTLLKLNETGVAVVDVSGFGGTHWGRVEGQRNPQDSLRWQVAETFSHWGVSTVDALRAAKEISPRYEVWASGGIRSGLDAAKAMVLGARCVGFAKPILQAALLGEDTLIKKMEVLEYELRTALFCTGSKNVQALSDQKIVDTTSKKGITK